MKKIAIIVLLLSALSACKRGEYLNQRNLRADLTRNAPFEKMWFLITPYYDSIDRYGSIYFSPDYPEKYDIFTTFGLQSINKEHTKYLRSIQSRDPNGPGFIYYLDTIEVQTWNNDSIICRNIEEQTNDTTWYSTYTFHGKYNNITKNVDGFIDPLNLSYRCPTCPGMVYYYYHGKVPAMFIPINY